VKIAKRSRAHNASSPFANATRSFTLTPVSAERSFSVVPHSIHLARRSCGGTVLNTSSPSKWPITKFKKLSTKCLKLRAERKKLAQPRFAKPTVFMSHVSPLHLPALRAQGVRRVARCTTPPAAKHTDCAINHVVKLRHFVHFVAHT
jgi:hypothetical protein